MDGIVNVLPARVMKGGFFTWVKLLAVSVPRSQLCYTVFSKAGAGTDNFFKIICSVLPKSVGFYWICDSLLYFMLVHIISH